MKNKKQTVPPVKAAIDNPTPLPWNGITENTRDPLELDDDAPPHPSELGNPFETEADAPAPWAIELSDHPGEPVFWNNADGWGGAETADRFTDAERQTMILPIGGAWVRMDTDTETKEKATRLLSGWVECVQRGDDWASDLVAWVVGNLKPGAVKGLAADWDDSQANMNESGENE